VQRVDYDRQLAEIRRRGWIQAAVVVPFVAGAIALGIFVNRAVGAHLEASLYGPACRTTCAAVGSPSVGSRPGGRGAPGAVLCECSTADERWQKTALAKGEALDLVLHWGGQEALAGGCFMLVATIGLLLGSRIAKH
jgi:hypothetical protein